VTSSQWLDGSTDRRYHSIQPIDTVDLLDVDDDDDVDYVEVEVWHTLMGPGDVRKLSLEQLDDFYRTGVIDEQTFLWKTGMPEWKRLANVLDEHPEPATDEPEESFHVLMEDKSVRVLSIEQIDDFYRLGVLEENTLLWQTGMSGWQRLSDLAGLDEHDVSTNTANAKTRESSVPTARYNACPTKIDNVAPQVRFAQRPVQPDLLSAPPVAMTLTPEPDLSVEPRSNHWLIRLSIITAALLVLGRNDALWILSNTLKQGSSYLNTERRAFGGPLFGTTRAVEQLIAETGGPLQPVRVPVVAAQLTTSPPAPTTGTVPNAATPNQSGSAKLAVTPIATAVAASANTAVTATNPKVKTEPALSGNVTAALLGQPAKPNKPAVSSAPAPARRKKAGKSTAQFSSGKTNYYDPLNGAL
jgi:hypothetical protein